MADRPNIVLVVMDTARAQNFSCYGHDRKTSPFLDSLAEENVKYEKCFTQENWTFPSHASIFTGKYVFEHGKDTPTDCSDLDTFVEELSENGYSTLAYSNNPFISASYGYDEVFDSISLTPRHNLYSGLDIDMEELNEKYESEIGKYYGLVKSAIRSGQTGNLVRGAGYVLKDKLFLRDSGAAETIEEIKSDVSGRDEPFFLFANFTEPHAAYRPKFPNNLMFLEKLSDAFKISNISGMDLKEFFREDKEPGNRIFPVSESLYDGEIRYLDGKLEELYNFIESQCRDTVFIFTSDHGDFFYEYGYVEHEVGLQDQVTHVPMIEVLPDGRSENVEEAVEVKNLHDHIIALSRGNTEFMESDGYAFSEFYGNNKDHLMSFGVSEPRAEKLTRYSASVTDGENRLIWFKDGEKVLYGSSGDIVDDQELSEQLSGKIKDRFVNPEEKKIENKEIETADEEIKSRLEDLGYM